MNELALPFAPRGGDNRIVMVDVRVTVTSPAGEQCVVLLGWVPRDNVEDALDVMRAPASLAAHEDCHSQKHTEMLERATERAQRTRDARRVR